MYILPIRFSQFKLEKLNLILPIRFSKFKLEKLTAFSKSSVVSLHVFQHGREKPKQFLH